MKQRKIRGFVKVVSGLWIIGLLPVMHTWVLSEDAFESSILPLHLALVFLIGSFGLAALAQCRDLIGRERPPSDGSGKWAWLVGCWALSWIGAFLLSVVWGARGPDQAGVELFCGWGLLTALTASLWLLGQRSLPREVVSKGAREGT